MIPAQFTPWQIAMATNAMMTFLALWYADAALARVSLTFVRGILSIYTVFCGLYITMVAAFQLPWSPLGSKFLPWV